MSSIQWGDFPTWLTAVATVAAAAGAFIAARIAFNQLQGQRAEIQRQSGEQARLAELQAMQLEQLKQQAELSARQIQRMDRQAEAGRRSQAERVAAKLSAALTTLNGIEPSPGEFAAVAVSNNSSRPLRRVRCRLTIDGGGYPSSFAYPGRPAETIVADIDPARVYEPLLMHAGEEMWFLWSLLHKRQQSFLLRFEDDAGVEWQLDQNLHLAEAPDSEW